MDVEKGENTKNEDTHNNDDGNTFMRQKLGEMWLDFGDNTSMHGLGRAIGSTLLIRRILWSLVVLGFTCYAIRNLVAIFQDYYSYPVSTTVGEDYKAVMPFPAVTFCNLNQIRKSLASPYLMKKLDEAQWQNKSTEELQFEVDFFLKQHSEEERLAMGHSLRDMLISCKFDGDNCSPDSFTSTYSMRYGNCFVFNFDGSHNNLLPGPNSALVVELNIQQYEYLHITPSAGMKMTVHPPQQDAFPDEEGIMLTPGFLTSVGLKKVNIIRSPPPYGQCLDVKEANLDLNLNMYFEAYGSSYTDKTCKKTCYQTVAYDRCSCCDIGYPCELEAQMIILDGDYSKPYCNLTAENSSISECLRDVQKDYLKGSLYCLSRCKPACDEITYTNRISMSKWPREVFYTNVLQQVRQATSISLDPNGDSDFVEKNLIRVEVFYESHNYQTIVTTPAYDWNRVLSDVGGQLGLWLGFSVLTALEWMEFLMDALAFVCRKLYWKSPKTTPVQALK